MHDVMCQVSFQVDVLAPSIYLGLAPFQLDVANL